MGLLREDGSPKPAAEVFPQGLGICQWFHYEDHRLDSSVEWLRRMGVRHLRTGVSWADWFRADSEKWFDRQMSAIDEFDVTMTLCFTPEHLGVERHYASPPRNVQDFADFASWAVERYAPDPKTIAAEASQGVQTSDIPKQFMDVSVGAR
jgi:beta-xylosidase